MANQLWSKRFHASLEYFEEVDPDMVPFLKKFAAECQATTIVASIKPGMKVLLASDKGNAIKVALSKDHRRERMIDDLIKDYPAKNDSEIAGILEKKIEPDTREHRTLRRDVSERRKPSE